MGLGLFAWAQQVEARPQASAGVSLGAAAVGDRDDPFAAFGFSMGARGDVLFFRERNAHAGFGPYGELLTTNFRDLQLGAGVSGLLPVHDYLPLVLSVGGYARNSQDFGWEPGLATSIFWGTRSYNFHSSYGMSAGLRLDGRVGLGESRETAIILGAQIDLMVLALPLVIAYEAIAGGS